VKNLNVKNPGELSPLTLITTSSGTSLISRSQDTLTLQENLFLIEISTAEDKIK
jgi:hypothetical protein